MLTENDVIKHIKYYLVNKGYQITKTANTHQKGIDIIAQKNNNNLCIEAKGETSSKRTSKRYGKQFNNSQVSTHIAMAILAAMIELGKNKGNSFAFAFPDNDDHNKMVKRVSSSLKKLGIKVYFVSQSGKVRVVK